MAADYPDRVAGMAYGLDTVTGRLRQVGCDGDARTGARLLAVPPPSWRPDLTDPSDLAEEVIRLEGYENIPVADAARHGRARPDRAAAAAPDHRAGAGRRRVTWRCSAARSARPRTSTGCSWPATTRAGGAVRLVNPIRDEEPLLRTTLLPGLLRVLGRNIGRGFADVALFETGLVFLSRARRAA